MHETEASQDSSESPQKLDASQEETLPDFSAEVEVDGIIVSVSAYGDAFPAGAQLVVSKLDFPAEEEDESVPEEETVPAEQESSVPQETPAEEAFVSEETPEEENQENEQGSPSEEELKTIQDSVAVKRTAQVPNTNSAISYLFDVKIVDQDGNELQPADGEPVFVSFSFPESQVPPQYDSTDVYHVSSSDEGPLQAEYLDFVDLTRKEAYWRIAGMLNTSITKERLARSGYYSILDRYESVHCIYD